MNSTRSIWSDLPMSTGIAALVCYAGVFNDVIGVEEMASRLGVSGKDEFYEALNELSLQGRLVVKDGFAALPSLEDKIALKACKIETAQRLIAFRLKQLKRLGRSPLIKFVGISGSLAANNPTKDHNDRVDIDLFIITRNQCLWLYTILRKIGKHLPWSKQEPELSVSYVMDGSNLMIANRNFYTATEIWNLVPVTGSNTHRKFLEINKWVRYYYPGVPSSRETAVITASNNWINKVFFVLYAIMRSMKSLSVDPLKEISFKIDLRRGFGLNLFGHPYGGYQAWVHKKFSDIAQMWFPELLNAGLNMELFPDELSVEIRNSDMDIAALVGCDYKKYG